MPHVRTRTVVVIATLIAVIGIGATAGVALSSGTSHKYRTATVTRGLVTRQLHGAGTLEPVAQASIAFPVAGTVNAVDVKVGDEVTTGTPVATLDTTSMTMTLLAKQATLASAELNLNRALNGEPVGGSSPNGSAGRNQSASTASLSTATITEMAFTAPAGPTSGSGSGSGSGSSTNLAAAVERVAAAQRAVDAAMRTEQRALATAATACSASSTPTTHGQTGGSTTTTPPSTTPSSTPPTTVPASSGSPNCFAAEQALLTAQQNVSSLQQSLADAEHTLEQLLLSQKNGSGSTSGSTSGPTSGSRSSSGSNGGTRSTSGAAGSGSSTAVSYSAEQLVAYQAAVDAARAAVATAQEALQQATLVSPIDGTVVAISIHTGDQISASSASETILIAGNGGYEVATTVDVNGIVLVKNGDSAVVVPDGATAALHGKVVFIGTPSVTSASTSYPVVIGLTTSPNGLHNGATASTTIDVASSKVSALTIPTSAVHTDNGAHTVTVLAGNKTSTVSVQLGVVGATATEITSGLRVGQTVVVADLGAPVPSSNADTRAAQNLTGGGGALTGGNGGFGRFGG